MRLKWIWASRHSPPSLTVTSVARVVAGSGLPRAVPRAFQRAVVMAQSPYSRVVTSSRSSAS